MADAAHSLPAELSSFVGRRREMAELRRKLLQPGVRLVTVVGPPGVGKTRLCLHVLRSLPKAFADGVSFVPLAAIRDPDLVVPAIAHRLDPIAFAAAWTSGRAMSLDEAVRSASPVAASAPPPIAAPLRARWGAFGSGDGQFNTPRNAGTDAAGNVYVADDGNARIQE